MNCRLRLLAIPLALISLRAPADETGRKDVPGATTPSATAQVSKSILLKVERLIPLLGAPEFAVREDAMGKVYAIGDSALKTLFENRDHADAEIRWRARKLITCIKWRIQPELLEKLAGVMDGYEQKDWQTRQTICLDLGTVGKEQVVPTLIAVVKKDPSPSVKRTAIATLYKMGDIGIAALIEAGVNIDGLEPYYVDIFISLGNRYLTEGKYDRAEGEYRKALKTAPKNSVAAYNMACVYSLRKDLEASMDWIEKSIEYGFDDFKWMKEDPDLENLQDLPRFKEILRRRGRKPSPFDSPAIRPDEFPDD